jgi:hypothetical protein
MKKGQVTVFVILGIVLLIVAALLITVKTQINSDPDVEIVFEGGLDAKRVHSFVTTCLSSVAKQGLEEIGKTGGNINTQGLVLSPIPTQSDVLMFSPLKVPYWHYLKDCSASSIGCMASNKPPLCKVDDECVIQGYAGPNSIEEQLELYVQNELSSCTRQFRTLEGLVSVVETGSLEVDVMIGESDVFFKLDYPLLVSSVSSESEENLELFSTKLSVNLKQIYELSSDIIEAEDRATFFEAITLDLITVYSGLDESKLPPMAEITLFGFSKKFWVRNEVEEKLADIILPYMQFVQFQNVANYRPIILNEETDDDVYEDGFWSLFDILPSDDGALYSDLEVNVQYTYEPIYLNIGDSELIQPTSPDFGNLFFLKWINFLMSDYRFNYDLSYPLLIKVTEKEAFNNEGFTFYFAVEVNLRDNIPMNSNVTAVEQRIPFTTSLDATHQLIDRTVRIETEDKHTGEPLEEVQISYYCGYDYNLGETRLINGKAIWEGKLPYCEFGGQLVYEEFGYVGNVEYFNNPATSSPDESFKFELWPIVEKEVVIKKRTVDNVDAINTYGAGAVMIYDQEATELEQFDKVIFNIARNKSSPFETPVPISGFLLYQPGNASSVMDNSLQLQQIENLYTNGEISADERQELLDAIDQQQSAPIAAVDTYTLEFAPGTYFVEGFLLYEDLITIPAETKHPCKLGCIGGRNDWGECPTCVDSDNLRLNETNISTWPSGGVVMNFTMSESQVYDTDKVTFYVLEMPIPNDWDDMLVIEAIEDYQEDKLYLMDPVFS